MKSGANEVGEGADTASARLAFTRTLQIRALDDAPSLPEFTGTGKQNSKTGETCRAGGFPTSVGSEKGYRQGPSARETPPHTEVGEAVRLQHGMQRKKMQTANKRELIQ